MDNSLQNDIWMNILDEHSVKKDFFGKETQLCYHIFIVSRQPSWKIICFNVDKIV